LAGTGSSCSVLRQRRGNAAQIGTQGAGDHFGAQLATDAVAGRSGRGAERVDRLHPTPPHKAGTCDEWLLAQREQGANRSEPVLSHLARSGRSAPGLKLCGDRRVVLAGSPGRRRLRVARFGTPRRLTGRGKRAGVTRGFRGGFCAGSVVVASRLREKGLTLARLARELRDVYDGPAAAALNGPGRKFLTGMPVDGPGTREWRAGGRRGGAAARSAGGRRSPSADHFRRPRGPPAASRVPVTVVFRADGLFRSRCRGAGAGAAAELPARFYKAIPRGSEAQGGRRCADTSARLAGARLGGRNVAGLAAEPRAGHRRSWGRSLSMTVMLSPTACRRWDPTRT